MSFVCPPAVSFDPPGQGHFYYGPETDCWVEGQYRVIALASPRFEKQTTKYGSFLAANRRVSVCARYPVATQEDGPRSSYELGQISAKRHNLKLRVRASLAL